MFMKRGMIPPPATACLRQARMLIEKQMKPILPFFAFATAAASIGATRPPYGAGGGMNQRGFIYVVSLGVVLMLVLTGTSILIRGVSEMNLSERFRDQSEALHFAEAGVDQAAINLRTPSDLTDDLNAGTLPNGTFQIDSPPASVGNLTWQVKAHGTSTNDPSFPRHIEATFRLTPKSVFEFALFGDRQVNVSGSAFTDSYDSGSGVYDPNNHQHSGDIGTNATTSGGIQFTGSNVFIDGKVAVGADVSNPLSVVTNYDPLLVTGGTSPPSDTQDVVSQSQPFPMSVVTVPLGLTCNDYTVNSGPPAVLAPDGGPLGNGTYCYHNLTVKGSAELTATGNVTVYLTGQLVAEGNSTIGAPSSPKYMVFLMESNAQATLEDTITGSTGFYGSIYGPDATINIQGNADVYGSIIAETVNVTGDASIHYDEAMTERTDVSNQYKTALISWRETAN